MTLNVFSFQRAFTAKRQMALVAGDGPSSLAPVEAKDILDSLYLGLDCEITERGEFFTASSTVEEFITVCQMIIQEISHVEDDHLNIQLSNKSNLSLIEKNGTLQVIMGDEQVIIANLTIQDLYQNLVQDIQNNPDLYGAYLSSYANNLEQYELTASAHAPRHSVSC